MSTMNKKEFIESLERSLEVYSNLSKMESEHSRFYKGKAMAIKEVIFSLKYTFDFTTEDDYYKEKYCTLIETLEGVLNNA